MRKIIIILIISILGLEITSCASLEREAFQEAGEAAARKASQDAEEAAARKASQDAEEAAARKASQGAQYLQKKIYDAAYKEALRYYESEGNQASLVIAKKLAVKAASEKNRELGDVVGDVTVTIIASSATTAAATDYQAKNAG